VQYHIGKCCLIGASQSTSPRISAAKQWRVVRFTTTKTKHWQRSACVGRGDNRRVARWEAGGRRYRKVKLTSVYRDERHATVTDWRAPNSRQGARWALHTTCSDNSDDVGGNGITVCQNTQGCYCTEHFFLRLFANVAFIDFLQLVLVNSQQGVHPGPYHAEPGRRSEGFCHLLSTPIKIS